MKRVLCMLLAMLMLSGLCACGQSAAPAAVDAAGAEAEAEAQEAAQEIPEEAPDQEYRVTVTDMDGNPVPGVTLQMCNDSVCTLAETDDDGAAVFTAKEGLYSLHVQKVPLDMNGTDVVYYFRNSVREKKIILKAKSPAEEVAPAGFAFYNPEKYDGLTGFIRWSDGWIDDNIYAVTAEYFASSDKGSDKYTSADLFDVLCVLKDESVAEEYLKDVIAPRNGWESVVLEKVGSAEKLTCFLVQSILSEEELEPYRKAMGELFDEFQSLREDKETFVSGIRLRKPVRPNLCFSVVDLDGNPVELSEVFAGRKVTMVNIWETGCKPCIEEMPFLEELNKTFEEKDCQIIGICVCGGPNDDSAKAGEILTRAGVTYLNVIATGSTDPFFLDVSSYPTTYYVDSEGSIMMKPVIGAPMGEYRQIYSDRLDEALAEIEG